MKGFTRFVQQTRELTASKDDRTEIPADVQSLLLKAEGVETLYAGVVDASIAFFPSTDTVKTKHADDPTRAQPLFKFGTGLEMMGGEYGSDRSARAFFDAAHGAMAVLATEKAMLDEAATAHYLDPKREICKETIKSAKAHYEKLKARR